MPMEIKCSCGQRLRVPDALRGRQGKCPKCGEVIRFPEADAEPGAAPPVSSPPSDAFAGFSAPPPAKAPPAYAPPVRPFTGSVPGTYRALRGLGVTCAVILFIFGALYAIGSIAAMVMFNSMGRYGGPSAAGMGCVVRASYLMLAGMMVVFGIWILALTRGAADMGETARAVNMMVRHI